MKKSSPNGPSRCRYYSRAPWKEKAEAGRAMYVLWDNTILLYNSH